LGGAAGGFNCNSGGEFFCRAAGGGRVELVTPSLVGWPPLLWPQAVFICRPSYGLKAPPKAPIPHNPTPPRHLQSAVALELCWQLKVATVSSVAHLSYTVGSSILVLCVQSHCPLPGLKTEFFIASGGGGYREIVSCFCCILFWGLQTWSFCSILLPNFCAPAAAALGGYGSDFNL